MIVARERRRLRQRGPPDGPPRPRPRPVAQPGPAIDTPNTHGVNLVRNLLIYSPQGTLRIGVVVRLGGGVRSMGGVKVRGVFPKEIILGGIIDPLLMSPSRFR